jgi:hypothetical protein
MVLNKNTGTRLSLPEHASVCVSTGTGTVRAARLEHHVKIFTRWDAENYLRGDPGDWIAARSPDDLYVVTADVFDKLYIRDCTGEDVSRQKGALRVVKKNCPIPVTFARETGILQTREGKVSYEGGDALLTGAEGESWPVTREYFFKVYVPASASLKPGQNGSYLKKENTSWAVCIEESFMVELPGQRGVLRGSGGDWLLQYAPNEYGVVDQKIFKATYDRV